MAFGGSRKPNGDYSQVSLDDFSDDSSAGDEGDFVNHSIRNQQTMLKQQDEGLDMLSKSVERLGQMSMGISEELGQQNKMLDAMETDLDQAGEELDLVTRKTKEFIKLSGGTSNCVIIMSLSVVALILFFLVIYF